VYFCGNPPTYSADPFLETPDFTLYYFKGSTGWGSTFAGRPTAMLRAPVITSPDIASGNVGTPFSYQITASNGPLYFTALPLPAGLSLNASAGFISGTPLVKTNANVILGAVNPAGTNTLTLNLVIGGELPIITSPTNVTAQVGIPINFRVTSLGAPDRFEMSGSLPPGLGFDVNTGIISGTASRSGVFVAVLRSIAGVSTSPVVNVTFNVPPMTGTFTNQAFASSVLPGNPAASALDGNLQTFWISQNDGFPKTLAYDFGAPSAVSSVWLNQGKSNLASSHATQLQILASDDGTNWFVLKEFLNMTNGPNVLTLDPVQTNRYFALQALAGGSSTWAVSEVRLGVYPPNLTLGPATQSGLTLRLTGTVNPNGFVTAARFLYGTNNTNLNLTSNLTLTPNNGTNALAVTGTISSGLTLGRTYFYRLGASNVDGVANTEVGSILLRNTNAGLSGLVPNVGALSPAFAAAITNYTVSISNSASLFSLRPTLADGNASVTVNGSGVTSGSSSIPTSLNVGTNIFSAVVTAQDGTTTRTYRVAAIRAPMSLTLSNGGGGLTASDGYVASGPLNLTLGFAPTPGQVITLVNNTSGQATTGIFNGLLEGSTVTLAFGGNTFRFAISYAGGDGNDITLTRNGGRTVMTLAGGGGPDLLGSGYLDGSGTNSAFRRPNGLAVDGSGNVYVADTLNHRIRKVTPEGLVTTLAGSGNDGFLDGVGTHAAFYAPYGLALDTAGNLFVADTGNQRIRQIRLADTNVTSLAGGGAGFTNNGIGANASFRNPWALTADNQGFVYVADNENNQIRRISLADSNVSTLAGSSALGSADGIGTTATFGLPIGVALGGGNNLFVLDNGNNDPSYGKIRVIQLGSSNVTTLAGGGNSIDGTGTNASFSGPRGLAIDALGNLYVADTGRQTIRKVTSSGVVSTVAGTGLIDYIDGPVAQAAFYDPAGVAVDGSGTIYVADNGNHVIRRITEGFRPILTMGAASRSNNVLRLTGTVNPNGFVTTARFLYGTNRTNLNFTSSVSLSTNNGTNALAVTGTVTLTSVTNSPGFFRLVASNIDGVASTESTSLTTVSVASDGLGNTFLQVTGATPGPTRGGNAIGATRTVYFYASDSSATPSYSGVAWPHVKVSGQLLAGPGVTAVLTMSPAGALLINGRPVYQYINETGATTAAGIGTFWPGIRANGAGTTTAASGPLKP